MTIRWAQYHGPMDHEEVERIRKSALAQIGDTILVWVNEGDLLGIGQEVRPKEPIEIMREALEKISDDDPSGKWGRWAREAIRLSSA